jgi:hypothetical protein
MFVLLIQLDVRDVNDTALQRRATGRRSSTWADRIGFVEFDHLDSRTDVGHVTVNVAILEIDEPAVRVRETDRITQDCSKGRSQIRRRVDQRPQHLDDARTLFQVVRLVRPHAATVATSTHPGLCPRLAAAAPSTSAWTRQCGGEPPVRDEVPVGLLLTRAYGVGTTGLEPGTSTVSWSWHSGTKRTVTGRCRVGGVDLRRCAVQRTFDTGDRSAGCAMVGVDEVRHGYRSMVGSNSGVGDGGRVCWR